MRRSVDAAQSVFVGVALIVGLGTAYVLAGMIGHGEQTKAFLIAAGLASVVASLASLDVAVACLITLGFLDGFIKGMDPSKLSVFIKDVFLLIAFTRWIWLGLSRRRWPALRMPFTVPALLFVVYCTAEMFNTTTADFRVALAGFRTWVVWIPVAYVAHEMARTRKNVQGLMVLIIVMGLLTGIYGIIQYRIGFGHLINLSPGFAFYARRFGAPGETVRATSTFVSPGAFGAAMSLSCVIALAGAVFLPGRLLRVLSGAAAAVCLVGLGASASRAPLLGLVAGGVALLVLMRKPRVIAALMLIALLVAWIANSFAGGAFARRYNRQMLSPGGIYSRVAIPFRHGWESVQQHPLGVGVATGIGIGRGAEAFGGAETLRIGGAGGFVENEYGRALRELGVPGVALWLWMLWRVFRMNLATYRRCRTSEYRLLAAACLGVTISIFFQLAVGSALYLAPGGLLFWAFAAISYRLPEIEARELTPVAAGQPARSAVRAGGAVPAK